MRVELMLMTLWRLVRFYLWHCIRLTYTSIHSRVLYIGKPFGIQLKPHLLVLLRLCYAINHAWTCLFLNSARWHRLWACGLCRLVWTRWMHLENLLWVISQLLQVDVKFRGNRFVLKMLWCSCRSTGRICHIYKWLQSGRSGITVTRLSIWKNSEAAWCAKTNSMVLWHHHHSATLSRHKLRLLLENGQCLPAHVRRRLWQTINIFYISFTKFDCIGRIHSVVGLVDRVQLLLNDLNLATRLQLLVKLIDAFATIDLLHEVRRLLLLATTT